MQNWIRNALKFKGLTQQRLAELLSEELGVSFDKSMVNKMCKGTREISATEAIAIAKITSYAIPASVNNSVVPHNPIGPKKAPLRGTVAAGLWLENDLDMHQDIQVDVPYVVGRFPTLTQFCYKVSGPSMNADRIFDGDYLICVNYWEARESLTDGDTVIVERRRHQLSELTCKRLVKKGPNFELWPKSTDPAFQNPIFVKRRDRDLFEEDGTEIEIIALVVGVFAPR